MELFTFWIVSQNAQTSLRFSNLLKSQNWKTSQLNRISNIPLEKGLAIFEVSGNINLLREEVRRCLVKNKCISMIAFGDKDKVPNSVIVSLLEMGIDDFFYSEIEDRLVLAKIKAHLRRIIPAMAISMDAIKSIITSKSGCIEVNRNTSTVIVNARSKQPKKLSNITPKEFNIMALLVASEDIPVTRNTILENIWGNKCESVFSGTIDKHIESLRKKLGNDGKKIKSIYGQGYVFSED